MKLATKLDKFIKKTGVQLFAVVNDVRTPVEEFKTLKDGTTQALFVASKWRDVDRFEYWDQPESTRDRIAANQDGAWKEIA